MEIQLKSNIKKVFPRLSTYLSYKRFQKVIKNPYTDHCPADLQPYLNEIREKGYIVVPNYFLPIECQNLRSTIIRLLKSNELQVQRKSDMRLFGIEKHDSDIMKFHNSSLGSRLASSINGTLSKPAFTLAGYLTDKNASSGEGWHRDAFHSQFKAMVYLTDVGTSNGPFEILEGSHKLNNILSDMRLANLQFNQFRISDKQVEALFDSNKYVSCPLTGKAGTLVYFNSSAIHRGRPLEKGARISLTTYFFESERIGPDLFRQFNISYEN